MVARGVFSLPWLPVSVASPWLRLCIHSMLPRESRETTLCNVIYTLDNVYTYRFSRRFLSAEPLIFLTDFNVMCEQRHRNEFKPFLNGEKTGSCKPALKSKH